MIDFSNFFITYTPTISKLDKNENQPSSWNLSIYNNYSDVNLGIDTSNYSYSTAKTDSNLWDSLGWGRKEESVSEPTELTPTESITSESTTTTLFTSNVPSATDSNLTVSLFDGTHYTFVKLVAPVVKAHLITANSKFNLGLNNDLIELNTRRITLQFLMESGKGVSAVCKANNNLGGLKYSSWEDKYGGSRNDKNSFTKFKSLDGFFQAYFGGPDSLYIKRDRDVLYATSDLDFVKRLLRLSYFGNDNPLKYYNLVFSNASIKAWNQYVKD